MLVHTIYWLLIMKNGCIQLQDMKYPLQERMSGKGSLLAETSWLSRCIISMENPGLCYVISSHGLYVRSCGHVSQARNPVIWSGEGKFLLSSGGSWISKSTQPYQVSWHSPLPHKDPDQLSTVLDFYLHQQSRDISLWGNNKTKVQRLLPKSAWIAREFRERQKLHFPSVLLPRLEAIESS